MAKKPKFDNGAIRVTKAKAKIKQLTAKKVRTNLDTVSDFTVDAVSWSPGHPQRRAAWKQKSKRKPGTPVADIWKGFK